MGWRWLGCPLAAAAVDVDVEADDGGAAVVDGGIVDAVHWILFYELASPSMPRRAEHGSRLDSIVSVAEHRVRSCFLGRLYRRTPNAFSCIINDQDRSWMCKELAGSFLYVFLRRKNETNLPAKELVVGESCGESFHDRSISRAPKVIPGGVCGEKPRGS